MRVRFHKNFKKAFKKRVASYPKMVNRFRQRLDMFVDNPSHPSLRTHHLSGRQISLKAFSVTGDMRVVYKQVAPDEVIFLDIGTHSQVYR